VPESEKHQSTRREFLRIVVVGGGVMAGLAAASATSAAPTPGAGPAAAKSGAVGLVETASKGRLRLRTSTGLVDVVPAPNARLYSGAQGEVADFGSFVVGDRVAVEGVLDSKVLVADSAGSIFEPIHLTVDRVDARGGVAHTTRGQIRLTPEGLPFTPAADRRRPAALTAGSRIDGLAWRDPRSGEQCLLIADAA
jgi:hypothetical protein